MENNPAPDIPAVPRVQEGRAERPKAPKVPAVPEGQIPGKPPCRASSGRRNPEDSPRSGQSLVETALVLPLFLFIFLGALQMGLVYQAQYLLKYAAFRAAREGAVSHACVQPMEEAAMAVLAPIMGMGVPLDGAAPNVVDGYAPLKGETDYAKAFARAKALPGPGSAPLVKVVVCGPLEHHLEGAAYNGAEIDFDDPRNLLWKKGMLGKDTLREFERTKLRVQVQYLQQLVVPFANWVVFHSWAGMALPRELRMIGDGIEGFDSLEDAIAANAPGIVRTNVLGGDQGHGHRHKAQHLPLLFAHAKVSHRYFIPLQANYAFRMQSNLFPEKKGCQVPETNDCWHYADGEEGAA